MSEGTTCTHVPEPSVAQQRIMDRIAMQRQRLRARHAARVQALTHTTASEMDESSAVWRAIAFAREHPAAVAALTAVALVAGPRRMVRWVGIALPLLMRLRS